MPQNFIAVDRDQAFLMPPSLWDWVAEDHLVWTVLAAVEEMDLSAFYAAYRPDGHGRAAYEPSLMVPIELQHSAQRLSDWQPRVQPSSLGYGPPAK